LSWEIAKIHCVKVVHYILVDNMTVVNLEQEYLLIFLVFDRSSKEANGKLVDRIVSAAFERGLLLLSCSKSTIRIAPALTITRKEIDEGLAIFEESIRVSTKESANE